jgi:pimeloyl-ACP methyl ester carboxylesterase
MANDDKTITPPSLALLAAEGRGLLDIPGLLAAAPILASAPRGQPHPVVVLPGLGADDRSTIAIRGFLETLGYQVHGWGRGRNVRAPAADLSAVVLQVSKLRQDSGRQVSLVGWSRGGIIAREVARQVATLLSADTKVGGSFCVHRFGPSHRCA